MRQNSSPPKTITVSRTRDRNFGSIRNAIAYGMNVGAYCVTCGVRGSAAYHWRLVGDQVEHKRAEESDWQWLDEARIDRTFSLGVFGRAVRFSLRALALEVASRQVRATRASNLKPTAGPPPRPVAGPGYSIN